MSNPVNNPVMPTDAVRAKLLSLDLYVSDTASIVLVFGRFLAGRLPPDIVAEEFVLTCEVAIIDLEKGIDASTGRLIRNELVGHPSATYALLREEIACIADAVFPPEFAGEVRDTIERIRRDISRPDTKRPQ